MQLQRSTARAFIQSKKCELISCFQNDSSYILQKAHSKDLLAQHEYQRIKSTADPVERATDLLDVMLVRGEDTCKVFQDMLAEVLDTYPQLSNLLEQPPAPPDPSDASWIPFPTTQFGVVGCSYTSSGLNITVQPAIQKSQRFSCSDLLLDHPPRSDEELTTLKLKNKPLTPSGWIVCCLTQCFYKNDND